MEIKRVWSVYWSATGNTKKLVSAVAARAALELDVPCETVDFTLPAAQTEAYAFAPTDLVIFGTPTYAGKVPNKVLPLVQSQFAGNGALCAAVVTFGNRSYDNALAELCATLELDGFHTVTAAAFVGQHAFSTSIAAGRPDREDLEKAADFAVRTAEKARNLEEIPAPIVVSGDAAAPYYVPKGTDGQPAKFLKAKPVTDPGKCNNCGVCARVCPMGAINPENVFETPGICIKCQACVKRCTKHAKSFDDAAFLSHVAMLEQNFQEAGENEVFA